MGLSQLARHRACLATPPCSAPTLCYERAMISITAAFFVLFGVLSNVGGFIGWKKAGSKASLIAGSVSGALLLLAAICLFTDQEILGLAIGGVTSLLLAGRFVPAYIKTHKFMPQGLMALFALVGLALTAASWR